MIAPVATAAEVPAVARRAVLASGAPFGAGLATPKPLLSAVASHGVRLRSAVTGLTGPPAVLARGPATTRNPAVFFTDPDMNAQALFTIGAAGYGAAEFGEVAVAISGIHRGGDSYDSYYDAFRSMGLLASGFGQEALGRRNPAAARGAFLRAASYLANPLFFVLGTSHPRRQAAAYRAMNDNWVRAAGLLEPAAEPVRIPYGRTTMPGWLLRPPGAGARGGAGIRRPTIIFNNGNDAQNIGLYIYGAAEAVALGYNALVFEGPGQGSMLFLRGVPFRPDWEAVITPVVSYLRSRPDVDPGRIALIGWSQGGALAARAAAFEHRLAALVLDPGVVDYMAVFHLPQKLVGLALSGHPAEADAIWAAIFPKLPASVRFSYTKGSYPFRQPTFSALVRSLVQCDTAAYLPKITTPTLVTNYQGDTAFPGQGYQAAELLRCAKSLHEFTAVAGCRLHDAPMAPQRRNQVVFDWLSGIL
ncbi:MAG TPA: alpha/beta fold hydrolase [Streptosporangiaceae bacterium]|nr:alpha/beta fold hydrolase [Streptosporangiaceae bacterium]